MQDTGHAPTCVCGHCSSVRQECKWPQEDERFGHNWLPTRGNVLHCDHCGKDAIFTISKPDSNGLISTVTLAQGPEGTGNA